MRALWRASIWASDAIPPSEWKYRHLKRVWLPLYDVFAIVAGLSAVVFGSRLLNRIFSPEMVDAAGWTFTVVAVTCLAGVAFPRLWAVEMLGKSIMVGMIVGYMAAIALYPTPAPPSDETPNWFVIAMLAFGLPLACFRLSMLGEEWWTRHTRRATA